MPLTGINHLNSTLCIFEASRSASGKRTAHRRVRCRSSSTAAAARRRRERHDRRSPRPQQGVRHRSPARTDREHLLPAGQAVPPELRGLRGDRRCLRRGAAGRCAAHRAGRAPAAARTRGAGRRPPLVQAHRGGCAPDPDRNGWAAQLARATVGSARRALRGRRPAGALPVVRRARAQVRGRDGLPPCDRRRPLRGRRVHRGPASRGAGGIAHVLPAGTIFGAGPRPDQGTGTDRCFDQDPRLLGEPGQERVEVRPAAAGIPRWHSGAAAALRSFRSRCRRR